MATAHGTKESDESALASEHVDRAHDIAALRLAAPTDGAQGTDSARKRQRIGISMAQKQALIDNLQLEITERARKLRAQCNLQAQSLRTRIEIRINRVPMALRKAKMGELADMHKSGQQIKSTSSFSVNSSTCSALPQLVSGKDVPALHAISSESAAPDRSAASCSEHDRPLKRTSDNISDDANEGNYAANNAEATRKMAGGYTVAVEVDTIEASQILSPASANIRTMSRSMPRGKPILSRAVTANEGARSPTKSPVKQSSASNLLSGWAGKARSPRKNATSKFVASPADTANTATGSLKGKKAITASAARTKGAPTALTRRIVGIDESGESSTSTSLKRGANRMEQKKKKKEAPVIGKRGRVMGTIRRGVAGVGSRKAAAAPTAAPASIATRRVLRTRKE